MRSLSLAIILFVSCTPLLVWAQEDSTKAGGKSSYIQTRYANDLFNGTDYYFTQGTGLDLASPFIGRWLLSKILAGFGAVSAREHALFIRHDGFTPTSIQEDTILRGDRPFACMLFIGQRQHSVDPERKIRLTSEILIGFLGPLGKCRNFQETIHRYTESPKPRGWEFQISNDLILDYHVSYEVGLISHKAAELLVHGSVRAGSLYDDVQVGAMILIGKMPPFFEPVVKVHDQSFQLYSFGKMGIGGVLYDASLQGGLFNNKSVYTIPPADVESLRYSGEAGIVLSYWKLSLEYKRTWISEAFKGGLRHGWGTLYIKVWI
ncbi:MAG: lipid A deacylase LpxR family protein [Bacteroidetes bacterium]|nr:lipid A deacylase LpxR family protein [Bacteroidota bacterium]